MSKLCLLLLPALLIPSAAAQTRIDSPDWSERYQAFTKLSAQLAANPANKQKLIQLLRNETRVIQSTLEKSNGQIGVSSALGEGFGEYYSLLLNKVFAFAKADENADALRAVAEGTYDPRSPVATELVRRWRVTAPVFPEVEPHVGAGLTFASALEMMGRILGAHRQELDAALVERMEGRLMQGLRHSHFTIRESACQAAADAKFMAAIPVLRRIAKEDPTYNKGPLGRPIYPGREMAAQALRRLEKQPR